MNYRSDPSSSGFWDVALAIAKLPNFIPFSGLFWLGMVVVNYQKYPFIVYCLLLFWSLCSSKAAPQSLAIIKKDIDENGGLVTSQVKAGMLVIQLLQWPTFLAAIYSLSQ